VLLAEKSRALPYSSYLLCGDLWLEPWGLVTDVAMAVFFLYTGKEVEVDF